jgi:Na+/proline symporter
LYWRRATSAGAIASMVVGFAVCFAIYVANFFFDRPFPLELNPVIPGVLASLIGMVVASLLTQPVPERNLAMFFGGPAHPGRADPAG